MTEIDHLAHTLGELPVSTLVTFVALGAISLAAFTIYAVLQITRRGKSG